MYKKEEPQSIKEMFGTIAADYDRANFVMSFGLYNLWNKALVSQISKARPGHLIDLCSGTGDIAFRFLKANPHAKATLLDFCPEMLEVAHTKGNAFAERFNTIVADAQSLPVESNSVDAITIAYGIRNVHNPLLCFSESFRSLRRNGTFAILELTRPTSPFLHLPHQIYLTSLLPLLGKLAARNKQAYQYLSRSITTFSSPAHLEELLKKVGFAKVVRKPLNGGVATILLAHKL
jgi:demethylmenaquinone methyltransferase/2-methoxy-6-polyprenyl-1,4-benzoquinol methylase